MDANISSLERTIKSGDYLADDLLALVNVRIKAGKSLNDLFVHMVNQREAVSSYFEEQGFDRFVVFSDLKPYQINPSYAKGHATSRLLAFDRLVTLENGAIQQCQAREYALVVGGKMYWIRERPQEKQEELPAKIRNDLSTQQELPVEQRTVLFVGELEGRRLHMDFDLEDFSHTTYAAFLFGDLREAYIQGLKEDGIRKVRLDLDPRGHISHGRMPHIVAIGNEHRRCAYVKAGAPQLLLPQPF